MKKNNVIFITAIICVLICIPLGILIGNSLKKDKGSEIINNTSENSYENNNISNQDKEIINFLTADNIIISTDDVVASHLPGGYYFSKNNIFVYYRGEGPVRESNETISFKGSYTVGNNKIILNITEEEKAVGGVVVEDVIQGKVLTNYTREVESVNKIVEYIVEGFGQDSYLNAPKYIQFSNEEKLYQLGGLGDYLNIFTEFDVSGYDAYLVAVNSFNEGNKEISYSRIVLDEKEETYQYDNNLYINFKNTENTSNYFAEIYVNDSIITVASTKGYEIWSSDATGQIKITKIGDYYFIISKVAKQFDGDFVVIIDNNGNIKNYHNDVSFLENSLTLINGNVEYEIKDCKSLAVDQTCDSTKYSIN